MNTALTALRDKECHEIAHESPKYSGYPEHLETAKLAWDAAIQALTTAAGEFDEHSAKESSWNHTEKLASEAISDQEKKGWFPDYKVENAFVAGARFQHSQMSARGGYVLEIEYLTSRIGQLEARLAESERERDQFKKQYQTKCDLYCETLRQLNNINALIAQEGRRPQLNILQENTDMRIKLAAAEARVKELEAKLRPSKEFKERT